MIRKGSQVQTGKHSLEDVSGIKVELSRQNQIRSSRGNPAHMRVRVCEVQCLNECVSGFLCGCV